MIATVTCLIFAIFASASALDLEAVYTKEELKNFDKSILEDASLNFTQLTTKYGYPSEIHTTKTADGYIITIHRIPYGKACGKGAAKIPVIVQHGLFCSADDFIITGPQESLGYILADRCYDVWLPNARGNKYSRRHAKMNAGNGKFWEFSWHEMGYYDLPAVVDHILNVTGQKSLHYIGHSQGTTQFFIFASLRPEYQSKIRSAHALSPVAFMKGLSNQGMNVLALFHKPLHILAGLVGIHEVLPICEFLNMAGRNLCREEYPGFQSICQNILFLLTGTNPTMINATVLPAILGHTPAGSSVRQLIHYAQGIMNDGFKQYDHGFLKNIFKYGSAKPPSYPIEKIKVPISVYWSKKDWFVSEHNVDRLLSYLPNVIGKFKVANPEFGHLEFMWGIDVKNLVYEKLISILNRF